jgi:predicted membrane protein
MFSGSEIASHSKEFKGGSVTAIFGGAEVDLRDAMPVADARLDVFTAFGGVEIRVPEGWQVSVKGLPLFGGIDNITAKEQLPENATLLPVNATALFGGIEIKH